MSDGGVGGVSSSNATQGQPSIGGGGLTPDTVMLYCATQLNNLDEGIKQKMAQQVLCRPSRLRRTGTRLRSAVCA